MYFEISLVTESSKYSKQPDLYLPDRRGDLDPQRDLGQIIPKGLNHSAQGCPRPCFRGLPWVSCSKCPSTLKELHRVSPHVSSVELNRVWLGIKAQG